jgi:hypothetical protein
MAIFPIYARNPLGRGARGHHTGKTPELALGRAPRSMASDLIC